MSGDRHLRVVGAEPPKPRRRKGERTPLLSREEEQRFRQAMRNLQGAFGSWPCLAEAMGARTGTLMNMMRGARNVSGDTIVRAMRASGLSSLAELLGGPAPAERCRACGGIKPTRAAS